MATADICKADAQAEAINAAAQAAMRAENGEFVFATRDQVIAFVNALPPNVRVRWQAETVLFAQQQYRVTFWRSFWGVGGGRKTSAPAASGEDSTEETTQP